MARRRLTGVLLVGGASRRFGSPKALAQLHGETLAERAWRVLGEACDERLPFRVLDDGSDVRAPIAGVVAGLRAARNDVCVFLPVDVPLISAESLLQLAANAPAAAPSGPLPGAYRKTLLPVLERKLKDGDYSLRDLPSSLVELDQHELANVNTAAELTALQPRSRGRPASP